MESIYPMGTVQGDAHPGASELARRGDAVTSVTTIELVRPGVPDVNADMQYGRYPPYDRPLTVEVSYPARVDGANLPEQAEYQRCRPDNIVSLGDAVKAGLYFPVT